MKKFRLFGAEGVLSRTQTMLVLMIVLLVIALGSVIVIAYINLNTSSAFQAGYRIANLGNIQRAVIQLHMETNRILRDRSKNFEPLEAQRTKLDTQIEIAQAEASNDARITDAMKSMGYLLQQYDHQIRQLSTNPIEGNFRSSAYQIDGILDLLEKQMQKLYGDEETRFYENVGEAIRQQRTAQTLTISIGGLLLIFGVFFAMSIGRSVSSEFERAYNLLKVEVGERRRAEEGLQRQNAYLAALHETSLALMNRLEINDLLETIVARAAQLLGTEHGYVYLIDPVKQVMERKVGVGLFSRSMDFRMQRGEGLVGKVWESEMPLVVNDYPKWPHRVPVPGIRENVIRAVVGVPLKSERGVAGVLGVAHTIDSERTFGESEVELLRSFAQLASIAVDNANLFAQAEQRTHQIEALYQGDQELYRHLELNDVLQTLVNVAVDILKVDKSVLLVWNEAKTHLVPRAARGFEQQTLARMVFKAGEGLVGLAAQQAAPVTVKDTVGDKRVNWQITYPEHIRSFMHVPIIVEGQVFGIFNVNYQEPHAFGDEDVRLVTAIAQRAASAIENARLYQQAQQAATLEERQRLARELHDAVTQTLFSASIIADVLTRLWKTNPEEAQRRTQELRELTRGAMAEMRTLLLELRPIALMEASINDLIQQLAEATTGRARVPVNVAAVVECDLPLDVKIAFYRIAQEALNNISKHANANHVEVRLRCAPRGAELCIHDDGVGFDINRVLPDNLGLSIMRERAEAIGAQLAIHSQPQAGTEVVVTWQPHALIEAPTD
ncbi:MAG TPA: GAF domain-containing protein [Anaerolineae bacterium]|nr:GAF domain-containing protein [Anaerolineae bacterium]HQI86780.1 GAF domain-containing protein [Anaerolineae bacterium]